MDGWSGVEWCGWVEWCRVVWMGRVMWCGVDGWCGVVWMGVIGVKSGGKRLGDTKKR